MKSGQINKCTLINLRTIHDSRGDLTVLEESNNIPFVPKRTYFLHNVPNGSSRGGHAHRSLYQIIIAITGSFDVAINDGTNEAKYHLNDPTNGLLICPMMWREIHNFTDKGICLVIASKEYDESDYIRTFENFIKEART